MDISFESVVFGIIFKLLLSSFSAQTVATRRLSVPERGRERTKRGNERARGNDDGRRPVDGGNVMSRVRPTAADVVDRTCRVRAGRRWRPTTTTRPQT